MSNLNQLLTPKSLCPFNSIFSAFQKQICAFQKQIYVNSKMVNYTLLKSNTDVHYTVRTKNNI